MQSLAKKIIRTATCSAFRLYIRLDWTVLRYYPHVIPDDATLERWQLSEWPEYKNWIDKHSILTTKQWLEYHKQAKMGSGRTKITIVTPVFNTAKTILEECIISVRTQTSPFWELILVDDGSTNNETLNVLNSKICKDPRIRVIFPDKNSSKGISAATNRGVDAARGNFIVFLDHDDRLAPEAIQSLITVIEEDPEIDIIYSDRDMISLGGKRFMHLMKPDWSPDNLYAGNYIFHLMCYRLELLNKVGGLRSEYDGSQDYDLVLRCMELNPKVKHLPQVLYHWRQHGESVAMDDGAKNYAFDAGMEALRDALKRRKMYGTVTENKSLWRGNYQVQLPLTREEQIAIISLPINFNQNNYSETISNHPAWSGKQPYIFIHTEECNASNGEGAKILASWLNIEHIGMVSGRMLNQENKILYAGMFYGAKGKITCPYKGYDSTEPGYLAVTQAIRNISAPNPFSVMIKRDLWQQINGFDSVFKGPHAILDFALSALHEEWRIVYVPQAIFTCETMQMVDLNSSVERDIFYDKWKDWLQKGDPYYSPNLKENSIIYEVA